MKGKYRSQTAIPLREKLTGEDKTEEMKADYANVLQNHCNMHYSDFAMKSLEKNHLGRCFSPIVYSFTFVSHLCVLSYVSHMFCTFSEPFVSGPFVFSIECHFLLCQMSNV